MRPTVSFNYKPNISKRSFDVIQTDTFGTGTRRAISHYEDNLFPAYSYGTFGGLSFGIDNNLEMKVRGKNDTVDKKNIWNQDQNTSPPSKVWTSLPG